MLSLEMIWQRSVSILHHTQPLWLSHPTYLSVNDIIDQMPVLRAGVHPRCLVASREAEYSVDE